MNLNDLNPLLKMFLDKLREIDESYHLKHFAAVFAISTVLSMMGIDASKFFDDKH